MLAAMHRYNRAKSYFVVAFLVAFGLLYLPVRFVLTFEIFGYPVNSPTAGWLGPTPRGTGQCIEDVGKVNSWKCADTSVFTEHRFGCKIWLKVFGYVDD
jgi:hypothetical protein